VLLPAAEAVWEEVRDPLSSCRLCCRGFVFFSAMPPRSQASDGAYADWKPILQEVSYLILTGLLILRIAFECIGVYILSFFAF
jgi:hypothetical protein